MVASNESWRLPRADRVQGRDRSQAADSVNQGVGQTTVTRQKFLAGTAVIAFLSVGGSSFAADMGAKAPAYTKAPVAAAVFNWTGFYVGGHVGGASSKSDFADVFNPLTGTAYITVGGTDRFTANRSGLVAGAQAGYNWQISSIVLGVEGDLGYLGGDGRQISVAPGANGEIVGEARGGLYASFRGRVGVAFDRLLVFATGGVIGVNTGARVTDQFAPTTLLTNRQGFRAGWTVGGGLEYTITNKWTLKADYLYYDLGTERVTGEMVVNGVPQGAPNFYSWDIKNTGHIGRVGVNYLFNAPVVAKF